MAKCRQWFIIIQQIRHQAAIKIQRKWRYTRSSVLTDPHLFQKVGDNAACMVQKYIRGKLIRDAVILELSNRKIEANLSYFDELKRKIQLDAYEKIATFWKQKLESMRVKQIVEESKSQNSHQTSNKSQLAQNRAKTEEVRVS